ncbi:1-deoxy-D-xylulose-5-phosphate synthase N-terminal domain-containing protein [Streptomyces sp. NPDC051658]|uniref:1-deoxy-D-xylulose-5-phosphate synthase N-terminal domain-containing protein n=1 Tax=Streptomyces sp. NPDC051658 TaxID=3365667 RepID=UPI0037A53618
MLNDNGHSYAPAPVALANHLNTLNTLNTLKTDSSGAGACRNVFSDLGFAYVGPVDEHNTVDIETVLRRIRALTRSVVVHVMTIKGRGYRPAEEDEADCLHAVGTIAPATTGRPAPARGAAPSPSWTSVFGRELVSPAERRADELSLHAPHLIRPLTTIGITHRVVDGTTTLLEGDHGCSARGAGVGGSVPRPACGPAAAWSRTGQPRTAG